MPASRPNLPARRVGTARRFLGVFSFTWWTQKYARLLELSGALAKHVLDIRKQQSICQHEIWRKNEAAIRYIIAGCRCYVGHTEMLGRNHSSRSSAKQDSNHSANCWPRLLPRRPLRP